MTMNNKKILRIFLPLLAGLFGAQFLECSSQSNSPWNNFTELTREEQEAIDADIAFELMKKEGYTTVSAFEKLKRQELEDGRYAQDLQLQEYEKKHLQRSDNHSYPPMRSQPQQTKPPHHVRAVHTQSVPSGTPCTYLSVPQEMRRYALFHVKAKQLDDLSCGYNALFNAANFENHCGFANNAHTYPTFKETVMKCITTEGFDPKGFSSNDLLDLLGRLLDLQPVHSIRLTSRGIEQLFNEGVTYQYPFGASQEEKAQLAKLAIEKKQKAEFERIKIRFNKEGTVVIHFICCIRSSQGIPHAVLISAVKNGSGRGIYIFDNLNEPLTTHTELGKIALHLCDYLEITAHDRFSGPVLPNSWPSLNARKK